MLDFVTSLDGFSGNRLNFYNNIIRQSFNPLICQTQRLRSPKKLILLSLWCRCAFSPLDFKYSRLCQRGFTRVIPKIVNSAFFGTQHRQETLNKNRNVVCQSMTEKNKTKKNKKQKTKNKNPQLPSGQKSFWFCYLI